MTGQGWTTAEYRCGRCGASWVSTTEAEHITRVEVHAQVHLAAGLLQGIHPQLTRDEALSAASQLVGAVVNGLADGVDVASLRPAYALELTHG